MRLSLSWCLVSALCCYLGTLHAWDNNWDQPLHKECPNGQAFYRIYSKHDNGFEDRLWTFCCRSWSDLADGQEERWYNNVNHYDGILNFKCSEKMPGSVTCGVKSYHHNGNEDRRWSFKCCKPKTDKKICRDDVQMTNFINHFDGVINWYAPSSSQYLVGLYSYHYNQDEDRRWKAFYGRPICTTKKDECACTGIYDENWQVLLVNYDLDSYTEESAGVSAIATQHIDNYSDKVTTETSITVEEAVTDTSSFSNSKETSFNVESSFTAKIPFVGEIGTSLELGLSETHTWGEETAVAKHVTKTFLVSAPPNTHAVAKAIMSKRTIEDVPFTMTLRHRTRRCQCTVTGSWSGVEHYGLRLVVEDKEGVLNLNVVEQ